MASKFLELSFPGAKVPGSESSLERKFLELSLPGAKVPGSESSKNFRSAPGSESSRERKFHTMVLSLPGAKVLRSENSIIRLRNACTEGLRKWFLGLYTPPLAATSSARRRRRPRRVLTPPPTLHTAAWESTGEAPSDPTSRN